MGYGYGYNANGRMVLACDGCGVTGGVRKRTCTQKVLCSSLRTADGQRHALPYCPAPALCSACFKAEGGSKGIHSRCVEPAAKAQTRHDEEQHRLETGDAKVVSRCGSWHEDVPEGYVMVVYNDLGGERTVLVLPKGPQADADWLSEAQA